jgi:hypothetical protein
MSETATSIAFHSALKTARPSERGTMTSAFFSALVIVLSTLCWGSAPAQIATAASITNADAQTVLKAISSDKAKTQIYCQMTRLGGQLLQANDRGDSKKVDELFEKMYELGKKLGSEYTALIDGLQDIDPESEVGHEISSTLDALDNLCAG